MFILKCWFIFKFPNWSCVIWVMQWYLISFMISYLISNINCSEVKLKRSATDIFVWIYGELNPRILNNQTKKYLHDLGSDSESVSTWALWYLLLDISFYGRGRSCFCQSYDMAKHCWKNVIMVYLQETYLYLITYINFCKFR